MCFIENIQKTLEFQSQYYDFIIEEFKIESEIK